MRVLVACEESGVVRDAFRRRGHAAWSCDLQPTRGEFVQFHHHCDVRDVLIPAWWDLMIAHPTCTYLCNSGAKHLYLGMKKENGPNLDRWVKMREGAEFFRLLWLANIPKVAVENPIMLGCARDIIGAGPSQIIQPWMFGHGETKATGLWLRGLPKLLQTNTVAGREQRIWKMGPSPDRAKNRSVTFTGIADAMADQWGRIEA